MVPENQIHIIKNRKNTMFFGKSIDRREYYYNFPSWVPVYGIEEKSVFRWWDLKVSFEKVKHHNLYKESFESDINILVKITEPLKSIKYSKSYEWIIALFKRDILMEINKEISHFEGNEVMVSSDEINHTMKKTMKKTSERYGIKILDVNVLNTRKTSKKAEIPEFELEKISLLWEKAPRMHAQQ